MVRPRQCSFILSDSVSVNDGNFIFNVDDSIDDYGDAISDAMDMDSNTDIGWY